MSEANVDGLLTAIDAYIDGGMEALARGGQADLSGMEQPAAALLAAAETLTEAQRAAHAPRIQAVLGRLEALKQQLQERRAAVAGELSGVSQAKRAHAAYGAAKTNGGAHGGS